MDIKNLVGSLSSIGMIFDMPARFDTIHSKLVTYEHEQVHWQQNLPPTLLTLTVSPGDLGLTLSIFPDGGGAKIEKIDPTSPFMGHVDVGDRIVTIDEMVVEKLEDFTSNKERDRKFGIAKAAHESKGPASAGKKQAADESSIESIQQCLKDVRSYCTEGRELLG